MDKTSIFKDKLGRNIFRVTNVHNCNVEIKFICKEYIFEFCNVYISETGLVKIFTIKNKSKKGVFFIGRWDQKAHTLDIDIRNASTILEREFKGGKNNSSGHHPLQISSDPRIFELDIKLGGENIFHGNVNFNLNHGHDPSLFKN